MCSLGVQPIQMQSLPLVPLQMQSLEFETLSRQALKVQGVSGHPPWLHVRRRKTLGGQPVRGRALRPWAVGGTRTSSRCRGHVNRSRRRPQPPLRGEPRRIRPGSGPAAELVPPRGIAVTRHAHGRHPQPPVPRRRLRPHPSPRTCIRRRSRRADSRRTCRGRPTRCRRWTGHLPSAARRDEAIEAVSEGGGGAATAVVRR